MTSSPITLLLPRLRQAFLGLAVGDALGWPIEDRGGRVGGTASVRPQWELVPWQRREGGRYGPHVQPVQAGAVSDDTQLTLAVARSVLQGHRWWEHFVYIELPTWTFYERGGGGATKRAAQSWLRGRRPWADESIDKRAKYFDAGGNGTAMRALPHIAATENESELNRRLDLDALATHGHPYAMVGSRLYAWAANLSLRRDQPMAYGELVDRALDRGASWVELPSGDLPVEWLQAADAHHRGLDRAWSDAVGETRHLLQTARQGLDQGAIAVDHEVLDALGVFGRAKGAGHVTAVAAVFLAARFLTQPREGLMTAAFARGADTDTLAAMTGGLLGALSDSGWIEPLHHQVQDGEYIATLAEQVAGHRETESLELPPVRADDRIRLYRALDEATVGTEIHLDPFGHARVTSLADLANHPQFVRAWVLESDAGQTLYIKRYDKGKDGSPRWRIERSTTPADQAPVMPEPQGEVPRGGLVLLVSDLDASRDFYEGVLRLPVTRADRSYLTYAGWLVTERDRRAARPLTGAPNPAAAIRLYFVSQALSRVEAALRQRRATCREEDRNGKRVVVTQDPDGNVVELHARNGAVVPIADAPDEARRRHEEKLEHAAPGTSPPTHPCLRSSSKMGS